jgi:Tfp pilus assembly protein PilF
MTRDSIVRAAIAAGMALASALMECGCASRRAGPYQPQPETARDGRRADGLNAQASELLQSNPEKAERLLREALTADLFHGAAHNNLGVLYLQRGLLYEAAAEFEWARKLMPGHPDPRVNLALTLERAGRTDDALGAYAAALEAAPEHVPAMQGLARLQVRSGREDERTPRFISEIAMRGETPEWREWARRQMTKPPRPTP